MVEEGISGGAVLPTGFDEGGCLGPGLGYCLVARFCAGFGGDQEVG